MTIIEQLKYNDRYINEEKNIIDMMMKHLKYFFFIDDWIPFLHYIDNYLKYNRIVFSSDENNAYLDVYKYIYDAYLEFCKLQKRPPFDLYKANISETCIYDNVLNDKTLQAHVKDLCCLYNYKPSQYVDNESEE